VEQEAQKRALRAAKGYGLVDLDRFFRAIVDR